MRAEYSQLINEPLLRILKKGSVQNSQNQLGADQVVSGMPFSKARA